METQRLGQKSLLGVKKQGTEQIKPPSPGSHTPLSARCTPQCCNVEGDPHAWHSLYKCPRYSSGALGGAQLPLPNGHEESDASVRSPYTYLAAQSHPSSVPTVEPQLLSSDRRVL